MHLGNITAAGPDPVDHLTNTTRNMSIAPTLAQASSRVGPSIGGYGEEHRGLRTLGPGPGPGPGPAQPLQQSQSGTVPKDPFLAPVDCSSCLAVKKDNYCDRKVQCSGCIKRNVRCVYEEPDCDYCRDHQKKCNGKRPCAICARKGANCHYSEIPKGIEEPAAKARGTIRSSGPAQRSQQSRSGIGGYGEQHRRTLGPDSGPGSGPAQPLQQSRSGTVPEDPFLSKHACYSCQTAKNKSKPCDRKETCSNCIDRNVPCVYQGRQFLAKQACYSCKNSKKWSCDRKGPCSNCIDRNLPCVYEGEKYDYESCDHCISNKTNCNGDRPCSMCLTKKLRCNYSENPNGHRESAEEAGGTIGPSGVDSSRERKKRACDQCLAKKTWCNGKDPCSKCISNGNPKGCKHTPWANRGQAKNSNREIDVEAIVPNVRIRREDHSEDFVYVHPPGNVRRPEGVAENMIIGWDRRGSWVIRPANGAGLLPGELGINDAGDRAIRVDEGEPAGEMGGMRDMRTAATTRRPPTQPQGFDAPVPRATTHGVQAHGVPGPSLAGSVHPRGSTESPPADDHHDLGKRQRRPPQT